MSDFSSLLFLSIALCADAFTAGFVYGAGNVKIPLVSALIMTALSSGILSVSLISGSLLKPFLPMEIPSFLSVCLLILLGFSNLTAKPTKDTASHANQKEPEVLSSSEAFCLGIALSLDNAAAGLGAGLSGSSFPILITLSLALGLSSVLGGCFLGKKASFWSGVDFSKYSGIILIILGLMKLV